MPADARTVVIDRAWDAVDADLLAFDRLVHAAEDAGGVDLVVRTTRPGEVWLRYQRLAPRRNAASSVGAFDVALARHRARHDLRRPLVRADHDHAIDTWQWLLRLAPDAPLELQLAALLHDVERLESEADRRVEHLAPDYQRFKDAHARRGAELAAELLQGLFPPATIARVAAAIVGHEHREAGVLADADALSFFALNSPGYLRWFGPETTARKLAWTYGRLSEGARAWLDRIRLEAPLRAMLRAVVDQSSPSATRPTG